MGQSLSRLSCIRSPPPCCRVCCYVFEELKTPTRLVMMVSPRLRAPTQLITTSVFRTSCCTDSSCRQSPCTTLNCVGSCTGSLGSLLGSRARAATWWPRARARRRTCRPVPPVAPSKAMRLGAAVDVEDRSCMSTGLLQNANAPTEVRRGTERRRTARGGRKLDPRHMNV